MIGVVQGSDEISGSQLLKLLEYYTATIQMRYEGPYRPYKRKRLERRLGQEGMDAFMDMEFTASPAVMIGDEVEHTFEFMHFSDPEITVILDKPVMLYDEYDANVLLTPSAVDILDDFDPSDYSHVHPGRIHEALQELDMLVALRDRRKLQALVKAHAIVKQRRAM